MTPTLLGRLQTRVFLLGVVGLLWTLVLTPWLPAAGALDDRYRAALAVLGTVLVLGLAWELVYHALQQLRWEKDWPVLLSLVTGYSEGAVVWLLLDHGLVPAADGVPAAAFAIQFASTWLLTWLFLVGPMRVLFLRWRFSGGRLL